MTSLFQIKTSFHPTGDQPQAIAHLVEGIRHDQRAQVLLGVTGSGKTFSIAHVIAQLGLPTLILSHNKTLAAQLYLEFREFFPENAVEYFVSYYDYYQPEAYLPQTDTYIAKDAQINEEIDLMRHSATRSLLSRKDVIIVSSISCIYGLGSPDTYENLILELEVGQKIKRQEVLRKLVDIQYQRSDADFNRGKFRVRGDCVEIFPVYEQERAVRIEFFDDDIEAIVEIYPGSGQRLKSYDQLTLYPASHYVSTSENRQHATHSIREELRERIQELESLGKYKEAQRLAQRTLYDLEMIEALGYCQGIENYSRHFTARASGLPPPTLMEYFQKPWLLVVDESHVTVPQIGGMSRGDRARKMSLVEHGFRLPSALDNRPLNFQEWEKALDYVIYVSATPGEYELQQSGGQIVEQVIRPTGLLDPQVEVRSATYQVEDLLQEIRQRVARQQRVLVTTLTKKLAEDLTRYYQEQSIRVKYLHSDIDTLERTELLRDLRMGTFDVLIGINLLREGLDLPEVSLVAILDADKEGFLRSHRSLIQTMGRAARHQEGYVILYADKITQSMSQAIEETQRRRLLQEKYNQKQGIVPKTIQKAIPISLSSTLSQDGLIKANDDLNKDFLKNYIPSNLNLDASVLKEIQECAGEYWPSLDESLAIKTSQHQLQRALESMHEMMLQAAQALDFEKAALFRNRIQRIKKCALEDPSKMKSGLLKR